MNCLNLAAVTNYHRLKWLKEQTFISHSSGGWEVQDQGAGSLAAGELPLSGLQTASCLLCPDMAKRWLACCSSYKGTNAIHEGGDFPS